MITWTVPPSTPHATPLTYDAASEQRKTITAPISARLGKAANRPRSARGFKGFVARRGAGDLLRLIEQAAGLHPHLGRRRSRADRVHQDAAPGVGFGVELRKRELGRLGDGVLGHVARRALAGRRGDVDDPAPAALGHGRDGGAHQAHRRHHVQVPRRLPVLVGNVGELSPLRLARVVDDHVELAEALGRLGDDPLGRAGVGDVERERRRLAALAPSFGGGIRQLLFAAGDQEDRRTLFAKALCDVKPDAAAARR